MVMLLENQDDLRERIGRKASTVAIVGNIFLTIFNFVIGTLSGSSALIAESAHTLSDVLTSLIAFVGFKIGMKPADDDHQYGHGRAEPLVGLVIVVFLVFVAYEILSGVYIKLISGNALVAPDLIAAGMALVGILTNVVLTKYLLSAGEKIHSPAIIADGQHQKVDIFSCIAIFVGVLGSQLGYTFLDPLVAIIIALIVIKTAIQLGIDNVNILMGKVPSNDIIKEIESKSMKVSGVKGVHGIRINPMGPYCSVVLHIELSGELKLKEAHVIAHNVEHEILTNVSLIKIATVHVCPHEEECGTEDSL
ncbi:cation diffusion facilitator family transporter [Methanobacterium lacus]|uniref:Cation diffusion facilitator family transporter n=2 Tax=Methanobacterium lacus (strain AL-21) TaxID=877455 RepID=F0TCL0_METLA|nr:cation diffusion facilitator family transporter [Methanobacterium lacus]